jgi:hypothetical protein
MCRPQIAGGTTGAPPLPAIRNDPTHKRGTESSDQVGDGSALYSLQPAGGRFAGHAGSANLCELRKETVLAARKTEIAIPQMRPLLLVCANLAVEKVARLLMCAGPATPEVNPRPFDEFEREGGGPCRNYNGCERKEGTQC